MVLRDFAWRNPEKGEEYLNILFSFARDQLSDSQKEREKIFSIFERNRYNEDLFAAYIPVMEIFWENFKDTLGNCFWKNWDVLKSFSVGYFRKRTSTICRIAFFMAPVEYSNDSLFRQRISDANEIMLNGDPSENLQQLLNKLCNAVPSIRIPHNDDVFNRLRFFANEAEEYMRNKELIQYDSIKKCIQLLKISIDDMECFLQLLHETEKDAIPIGKDIPHISLDEMDITIQQFKHALSTPGANRDASLQHNLQQLFNEIQASNIVLSDHHYKELQDIISYGEKMFVEMPYSRIILAHHKEIKN